MCNPCAHSSIHEQLGNTLFANSGNAVLLSLWLSEVSTLVPPKKVRHDHFNREWIAEQPP